MSDPKGKQHDSRRGPFDAEIRTRVIVHFLVWLVGGLFVVVGGIHLLEERLERHAREADRPVSPLAEAAGPRQPPEPRLQPTPQIDLENYLAEEHRRASAWGWVDERTGVVHMPVDRALEIVAARGLPTRVQATAGAARAPHASPPPGGGENAPPRGAPHPGGRP